MICIYQEKEQQFVHYRFPNGTREQQYILLESLYLQMLLVGIFTYIYIYIFINIATHIYGKVEAYIIYNIILKNIIETFFLINNN
jgi:hypothetical protein